MFLIFSGLIFNSKEEHSNFDYDAAWEQVKQLYEQEGKTQTALAKIEEIYQKSILDNRIEERYAAIQYKTNNLIKDNKEAYQLIDKELSKSNGLLQYLLLALKADFLGHQINRSRFSNNTDIINDDSSDIESMSRNALVKAMIENFAQSLSYADLKSTPLSKFQRSMTEGDSIYFIENATLFDVIALKFTSYLEEDLGIDGIADFSFTPDQLLSPLPSYLKLDFTIQDDNYLGKAALTYQNILKNVTNNTLRFLFDKKRLRYFSEKYGSNKYAQLSLDAFDYHIEYSENNDIKVLATLEKVKILIDDRKNYKLIDLLLKGAQNAYPNNIYINDVAAYLQIINTPEINVKHAEVYAIKQKKKVNIKHINTSLINISIFKIEENIETKIKLLTSGYNEQNFEYNKKLIKNLSITTKYSI